MMASSPLPPRPVPQLTSKFVAFNETDTSIWAQEGEEVVSQISLTSLPTKLDKTEKKKKKKKEQRNLSLSCLTRTVSHSSPTFLFKNPQLHPVLKFSQVSSIIRYRSFFFFFFLKFSRQFFFYFYGHWHTPSEKKKKEDKQKVNLLAFWWSDYVAQQND